MQTFVLGEHFQEKPRWYYTIPYLVIKREDRGRVETMTMMEKSLVTPVTTSPAWQQRSLLMRIINNIKLRGEKK